MWFKGLRSSPLALRAAHRGERFVAEVNTAISGNPEVLEYVRRLEAASDSGEEPTVDDGTPLPPAADMLNDVEEFLRGHRDDS